MSKKDKDGFDLSKAQRINKKRREKFLKAVETKLGRPLKPAEEKHRPISIKLHPEVYDWAKQEAERKGLGYQTVINETLLNIAKKKKSS